MTPAFRVETRGGRDLTALLQDRTLAIEVTEEAEDKSDRFSLRLDDRPAPDGSAWEFPAPDTYLRVFLGYRETGVVEMGTYRVDEVAYSAPPSTLEIKASAAALSQGARSRATHSYHRETLGGIARIIGARNGLTVVVDPELDGLPLPHEDQTGESDIAFLNRIALRYDAVARPLGERLVVARRGEARSAGGRPLEDVTLTPSDVSVWSYTRAARRDSGTAANNAGGRRAFWWDHAAGVRREVTSGRPPYEESLWIHYSEAQARAAVSTRSNEAARAQATFAATMPGRPTLQAEARVLLSEWRTLIPTRWRIKQVSHSLDGRGFRTSISCEEQPEQANVPAEVRDAPPRPEDVLEVGANLND